METEGDTKLKINISKQRSSVIIKYKKKILSLCNMKQSGLMPLCEGLKKELGNISPESIKPNEYINRRMDEYLEKQI